MTDAGSQLVLTELVDEVLLITLNRPEALNALSVSLSRELTRALHRAAHDDVRAVVITGAGKGFCAGADLREQRTGDVATEGLQVTYHPLVLALVALEKPVIAAVNGPVVGAGLAIALGADARIGAGRALFVPAFGAIGLIPDSGVGYLAQRVLGDAAALRWLASGRRIDADEAKSLGLLDHLADDVVAEAMAQARELATLPGRAYGLTKRLMWSDGRRRLVEQLDLEVELQHLAVADPSRAAARERVASRLAATDTEGEGQS
ncbi:enoyl-CoA hydratase/isomerase family protein [Microbacterium sp. A82]|uniref:enoyl-CoA hydratase/isomerase family protein n=1 Tax=Microbacterium sp. A82 TaxID=3450452 RepID=UPI003F4083E0